jgi:aspartate carbamoyltransferase catalytic subunit
LNKLVEEQKKLKPKNLLGMADLDHEDITLVLDTAVSMREINFRPIKKVPTLQGRTIVYLFFEASTRTRTSFEIAGKRLGADTINFTGKSSSAVKGETTLDTARNIEAMMPDLLVIRHECAGAPHMLARYLKCPIINAGDGAHEHPSQALLDMYTIRHAKGRIEGLKVAIIGDIAHSRVARSNVIGLTKMGARTIVAGPPTLLPPGIERLGCQVTDKLEEAIDGADVVMMLRVQLERFETKMFPSLREYSERWGLNSVNVQRSKPDAIVMHPGPINRGVEISPEVADGPRSVILEQVQNGVAVRMALLYHLTGRA